ncbi:MAG: pilus assembly protein TadG-related protein [Geobacteraceae bacterium]|nr:pilus assembly protein TadG-related protein [Geobacteraceae bacterium]
MGTDGGLNAMGKILNNKGIAVIYLAVGIIVFMAFVGLSVDIGYMYVVKGQLQNAADSIALAGAAKLDASSFSTAQPVARSEAVKFAALNNAAGTALMLDQNITNDPAGDVVVGNWDPTRSQSPVDLRFLPTADGSNPLPAGATINAVKAVARRTGESGTGIGVNSKVSIFFGKIIGWNIMGAKSQAIAAGALSEGPLTLCVKACRGPDKTIVNIPPTLFYWAPYPSEIDPGTQGIAWTIFSETSQQMNKDFAISFLCGNELNACGKRIYTTNSNDNDIARQFRCAFKNPNYRSADKTCSDDPQGKCGPGAGNNVTSWKVLVPLLEDPGCPPGAQPTPYSVVKYARIRVTEVYASGGGGTSKCACAAYDAPNMTGPTPNAIIIDQIECQSCGDTDFFTYMRPSLVK